MGPIDYLGAMPQTDFLRNIQGGFQVGLGIRQAGQAEEDRAKAQQAQQQYQTDIGAYMQKPTPQGAAALALRYPSQREAIKQAWEMNDQAIRDGELKAALPVYSALNNNRPDLAKSLIQDRITALDNSGQDSTEEKRYLSLLEGGNDAAVKGELGLFLAKVDDKFAQNFAALGGEQRAQELQPSAVAKAGADAQTAVIGAKFAESKAVQDLRMGEEQIKKWSADTEIARQNSRIAAMNAAISREGNDLKRQELRLKVQDAVTARDDKLREKVATVESARSNIDNMVNTIDRLAKNESLADVVGSLEGRVPGALGSVFDDEESDAIALIDNVKSQAFLAQIPNIKGMGALSNEEGRKLEAALQNLDRSQSEGQFKKNLAEAQRLMLKARKNIAEQYGVPGNAPDTPDAGADPSEIDALLKKYGGK